LAAPAALAAQEAREHPALELGDDAARGQRPFTSAGSRDASSSVPEDHSGNPLPVVPSNDSQIGWHGSASPQAMESTFAGDVHAPLSADNFLADIVGANGFSWPKGGGGGGGAEAGAAGLGGGAGGGGSSGAGGGSLSGSANSAPIANPPPGHGDPV